MSGKYRKDVTVQNMTDRGDGWLILHLFFIYFIVFNLIFIVIFLDVVLLLSGIVYMIPFPKMVARSEC